MNDDDAREIIREARLRIRMIEIAWETGKPWAQSQLVELDAFVHGARADPPAWMLREMVYRIVSRAHAYGEPVQDIRRQLDRIGVDHPTVDDNAFREAIESFSRTGRLNMTVAIEALWASLGLECSWLTHRKTIERNGK